LIEALTNIENFAGAAVLLALLIVYKVLNESYRRKGKTEFKKNVEQYFANDYHEMKCSWKMEDQKRLSEIRDGVRDLVKAIPDLKDAIKEIKTNQ